MPERYLNKYRINSTRLQSWDYGWNGWYFVTIKTKGNEHYFGQITNGKMLKSNIGKIAEDYWYEIPKHFDFVELGEFILMPDHVHGLLHINKPKDKTCDQIGVETRHCLVSTSTNDSTIGRMRFRNPGRQNLSSIIGSYKSIVSRMSHKINKSFAWQSRFYDKIIDDFYDLLHYEAYIKTNPESWNK